MKATKAAISANWMYDKHSKGATLWEAYENPSRAKENAYWNIYHEMAELGGHDLRITGANCFHFSCAYVLGDKLIYHTHANRFEYPRIIHQ